MKLFFELLVILLVTVSCTSSKDKEKQEMREALGLVANSGQATFAEIGEYPQTLGGLGFTPKAYPEYKITYSGTREDNFKVTVQGKYYTMTMENFSSKTIEEKENK